MFASGGSLLRSENVLLLVLLAMGLFMWLCSSSLAFWLGFFDLASSQGVEASAL